MTALEPYYDDGTVRLYVGDCRRVLPELDPAAFAVLAGDPPYGIGYRSGQYGTLPRSILGDESTLIRDAALEWWGSRPALVFGSWKIPRPASTRMRLVWDTKGANGMGALDLPWKPSDQEIYVLGRGFHGRRDSNVLRFAPVQSLARNGRVHPHEKPVDLMRALLLKCPPGAVIDPWCGSGPTLRAAKDLGRPAVGIELEERWCEQAARRLAQEVLAV
ncbi:MAG TPA: DNA methyltransferase [Actinomycetes bacterium]|nr:DNA methyltransferase [Actinomycetes bacterium]